MKKYFVTAINTGSGKTIVSAILTEALQADYWKPIQAGREDIDQETIRQLISNNKSVIHPESFLLQKPASPHDAAKAENIDISLQDFILPKTPNSLIIEGAGGILVPINENPDFIIDLAKKFDCEVILVADLYLGSINHSLLSIHELIRRNLKIKGIIFTGRENPGSENIILKYSGLELLFKMPLYQKIDKSLVTKYAESLRQHGL